MNNRGIKMVHLKNEKKILNSFKQKIKNKSINEEDIQNMLDRMNIYLIALERYKKIIDMQDKRFNAYMEFMQDNVTIKIIEDGKNE